MTRPTRVERPQTRRELALYALGCGLTLAAWALCVADTRWGRHA